MKKLKTLGFLITLLVANMAFTCCTKSDSSGSNSNSTVQSSNPNGSVTAIITPTTGSVINWSNSASPAISVIIAPASGPGTATGDTSIVYVVANNTSVAANGSAMSLTFPGLVGTYPFAVTSTPYSITFVDGASWYAGDNKTYYNASSNGSIIVTTATSTHFVGTFSYTSAPTSAQPSLASGKVTGTFDVTKN